MNMNQRTNVAQSGTAFAAPRDIAWGYDTLGQVTSADSSENTLDRAYQYDAIGNRQKSADSLTLPVTHNYTSNAVNQYSAITGQPPGRTQDDDGNLTTGTIPADLTANSTLVWDAENRLVKIIKPNGDVIDQQYDYQSRRIQKIVHQHGADPNNESQITNNYFVYDGWNPIAEYQLLNSNFTLLTSFTWGMDLSGSIQGAGGVGGLLSVHQHGIDSNNQSPITNNYFPSFDGNGNISEYLNNQGEAVAHYEYEPFGKTTVATGTKANDFTHRFSTKPLDAETGLYYYGHRWYDAPNGCWISRDPIEEEGGLNLYGFVGNDGVNMSDVLGMDIYFKEGRLYSSYDAKIIVHGKLTVKNGSLVLTGAGTLMMEKDVPYSKVATASLSATRVNSNIIAINNFNSNFNASRGAARVGNAAQLIHDALSVSLAWKQGRDYVFNNDVLHDLQNQRDKSITKNCIERYYMENGWAAFHRDMGSGCACCIITTKLDFSIPGYFYEKNFLDKLFIPRGKPTTIYTPPSGRIVKATVDANLRAGPCSKYTKSVISDGSGKTVIDVIDLARSLPVEK